MKDSGATMRERDGLVPFSTRTRPPDLRQLSIVGQVDRRVGRVGAGFRQVGCAFNVFEIGPAEDGPAEVGLGEIGPSEVGPGEFGLAEVGPAEVGPADVDVICGVPRVREVRVKQPIQNILDIFPEMAVARSRNCRRAADKCAEHLHQRTMVGALRLFGKLKQGVDTAHPDRHMLARHIVDGARKPICELAALRDARLFVCNVRLPIRRFGSPDGKRQGDESHQEKAKIADHFALGRRRVSVDTPVRKCEQHGDRRPRIHNHRTEDEAEHQYGFESQQHRYNLIVKSPITQASNPSVPCRQMSLNRDSGDT